MKKIRQTFVVIFEKTPLQKIVIGPFRSFKQAEGLARNAHLYKNGYVEPLVQPSQFNEFFFGTKMNDQLAKEIFDKFDMKITRKALVQYLLTDRNNKNTPRVVIEKHGEMLNFWKAYIYGSLIPLCELHRTRKQCIAMAQYKLAQHLAEIKTIEDTLNE